MMRTTLVFFSLLILVLAACGGGGSDDPTDVPEDDATPVDIDAPIEGEDAPTPIPADDVPEVELDESFEEAFLPESGPLVLPTRTPSSEGELIVALPGTLVASETEDPFPETRFDYIYFEQTGGVEDLSIQVEIFADGRIIVNDFDGTISGETIADLNARLDAVNFFGIQSTFLGPPGPEDSYQYRLMVSQSGIEKMVNAQDGFIPDEVIALLSHFRNLADGFLVGP